MRFSEFLEQRWLPAIKSTIRPSTLHGYTVHVQAHLIPCMGHLALEEVDAQALNNLYASLAASRKGNGTPGLSSGTIVRLHATAHRALRDAVRWGLLVENPADRADPPKQRGALSREMSTWSPEQLRTFLKFVRNDRFYPLWVLLATTGVRRGEALGLRWSDLNLEAGQIAIRQTIIEIAGKIVVSSPKTSRGRRVIALDASTVEILGVLKQAVVPADGSQLVFTIGEGHPLQPTNVTRRFQKLTKEAGLPVIRLHDLRHTHATIALGLGIHPKIVSERLGHATIALTLDIYSHAIPHLQTEAADKLGKAIFGP